MCVGLGSVKYFLSSLPFLLFCAYRLVVDLPYTLSTGQRSGLRAQHAVPWCVQAVVCGRWGGRKKAYLFVAICCGSVRLFCSNLSLFFSRPFGRSGFAPQQQINEVDHCFARPAFAPPFTCGGGQPLSSVVGCCAKLGLSAPQMSQCLRGVSVARVRPFHMYSSSSTDRVNLSCHPHACSLGRSQRSGPAAPRLLLPGSGVFHAAPHLSRSGDGQLHRAADGKDFSTQRGERLEKPNSYLRSGGGRSVFLTRVAHAGYTNEVACSCPA